MPWGTNVNAGGDVPRAILLERFRAKWTPVRVKKTRQNNKLEPGSDSIRTDKALAAPADALDALIELGVFRIQIRGRGRRRVGASRFAA